MTVQSDGNGSTGDVTSSTSKPTGNERLPVILEPPLLVPGGFRIHAPLLDGAQPLPPDSGPDDPVTAEEVQSGSGKIPEPDGTETETETGAGIIGPPTAESRMADEGPSRDEWAWKYDEHGKKIWYRKSATTDDVVAAEQVPDGRVGTVRFATRPAAAVPSPPAAAPARRPRGYWMVDDRGAYLWYRFVETAGGQYVRDPNVETIDQRDASPDDQPTARERLTWTGVGR